MNDEQIIEEIKQIAEYLNCNEKELVSEVLQLINKIKQIN